LVVVQAIALFPTVKVGQLDWQVAPPQSWKPALQVNPHEVPLHVAVALATAGHATQLVPHEFTEALLAHEFVPHSWKPLSQVNPQLVPLHVAVEFAGGEHATHEVVPQLLTDALLAHVPLQSWKPPLQATPHDVPLHVAEPFAGIVQSVQVGPHAVVDVLMTHDPLQRS
jgi:hypothetical protein